MKPIHHLILSIAFVLLIGLVAVFSPDKQQPTQLAALQVSALYETDTVIDSTVPITKGGSSTVYAQVYRLQVTGLQVGDLVDLTGTVSATNPYTYNAMFGCLITRTRYPDIWMGGAIHVARSQVLNITPSMHHYPFPITRYDRIGEGEDGDWYYHFVCYSASSSAGSGHQMQINPYGCLQAVVLRP